MKSPNQPRPAGPFKTTVLSQDTANPARPWLGAILACLLPAAMLQAFEPNYDEDKVPEYTLPDPLVMEDGRPVESAEQWTEQRRPELLNLFREHVYGRRPADPPMMQVEVLDEDGAVPGADNARRALARLTFGEGDNPPHLDVVVYLPADADGPVPAFVGMNFFGNHTAWNDPAIPLPTTWSRNSGDFGVTENRATEAGRGVREDRWPVDLVTSRGYALATIYCGDIAPDDRNHWRDGAPRLFPNGGGNPGESEAATIAWWSWGLSRTLDYLTMRQDIDPQRVAVMGHSRLGKTALWAGAEDERFALVISNNSGCGGAALSRRAFGETVGRINQSFPHWFTGRFKTYNENEAALPVDQHQLVALMAPRPVYIASATEDRWADPLGEYLSGWHANPVYALFSHDGLPSENMSAPGEQVGGHVGFHLREGGHAVTPWDWERFLDFADRHFGLGE